jgi:AraC-like DNA-binding protein
MSRSGLSRMFTAHFGLSIRRYIAQVRVARAMQSLERPGVSVTDIALQVGFYDLPRFDKVFRRLVGMSPSAYRRLAVEPRRASSRPYSESRRAAQSTCRNGRAVSAPGFQKPVSANQVRASAPSLARVIAKVSPPSKKPPSASRPAPRISMSVNCAMS